MADQRRLDRDLGIDAAIRNNDRVFPMSQSLRLLPAFEKLTQQEIVEELAVLSHVCECGLVLP